MKRLLLFFAAVAMVSAFAADKKISDLTLIPSFTTADLVPVVHGGTTYKARILDFDGRYQAAGAAMTSTTGDVLGTGPGATATSVVGIQGRSVSNTAPTDGQLYLWNASTVRWEATDTARNISASSNATLNSLVNLSTVGTITSGIWGGTAISTSKGGTGQTSANNGFNALAPDQTANAGKILNTNGANTSWASLSAIIDLVMGASQGEVLFRGVSAWLTLAPGTSGQVLTTNGASHDPAWKTSSGGGGGGLNTDFSNMATPTAASQNLIFDTGTYVTIQTKNDTSSTTSMSIGSGDSSAGGTGDASLFTGGPAINHDAGAVNILPANSTGTGYGGSIYLTSGQGLGTGGGSGDIKVFAANGGSGGYNGFIELRTSAAEASAEIDLTTGNSGAGDSAGIYLKTGTATGNRGHLNVIDGSEGTVANIFASVDTFGAGMWSSLSAIIDAAIGSSQGEVLYRGASGWVTLAPGTSGQVFTTNGASHDPAWATAAGGGGGSITSHTATLTFQTPGTFGCTVNTDCDLLTLSLAAGKWMLSGDLQIYENLGATTINAMFLYISDSSSTGSTVLGVNKVYMNPVPGAGVASNGINQTIPAYIVTLGSPTTMHMLSNFQTDMNFNMTGYFTAIQLQ